MSIPSSLPESLQILKSITEQPISSPVQSRKYIVIKTNQIAMGDQSQKASMKQISKWVDATVQTNKTIVMEPSTWENFSKLLQTIRTQYYAQHRILKFLSRIFHFDFTHLHKRIKEIDKLKQKLNVNIGKMPDQLLMPQVKIPTPPHIPKMQSPISPPKEHIKASPSDEPEFIAQPAPIKPISAPIVTKTTPPKTYPPEQHPFLWSEVKQFINTGYNDYEQKCKGMPHFEDIFAMDDISKQDQSFIPPQEQYVILREQDLMGFDDDQAKLLPIDLVYKMKEEIDEAGFPASAFAQLRLGAKRSNIQAVLTLKSDTTFQTLSGPIVMGGQRCFTDQVNINGRRLLISESPARVYLSSAPSKCLDPNAHRIHYSKVMFYQTLAQQDVDIVVGAASPYDRKILSNNVQADEMNFLIEPDQSLDLGSWEGAAWKMQVETSDLITKGESFEAEGAILNQLGLEGLDPAPETASFRRVVLKFESSTGEIKRKIHLLPERTILYTEKSDDAKFAIDGSPQKFLSIADRLYDYFQWLNTQKAEGAPATISTILFYCHSGNDRSGLTLAFYMLVEGLRNEFAAAKNVDELNQLYTELKSENFEKLIKKECRLLSCTTTESVASSALLGKLKRRNEPGYDINNIMNSYVDSLYQKRKQELA